MLNDNEMSIAHNVGALSQVLNRPPGRPSLPPGQGRGGQAAPAAPHGRTRPREAGRKILHGLKALVLPNLLWEELGFTFVGAVDGHNIPALEQALERAKAYIKPSIIHILTQKGHGYGPAEEDATRWHGVSPNGTGKRLGPSYTQVFGQTLAKEMRDDPRVVAVTAAMPDGTGLNAASREFPNRVFDVGIAEQHAVTFSAGLATQGFLPVVAIYSTFMQRAYDQIIHDVCTQKLPVFLALDRAEIVGDDGKTHQGMFDLSYLRCVPDLVVASPRDENELQHLIHTGLRHMAEGGGAFALRFPRGSGTGVALDQELKLLPIGKGETLRRGGELAILAIGNRVETAMAAADILSRQGIEATVIDARYLKPLDQELILEVARRCGRLMTVEENSSIGGFGSAVLECLAANHMADVQVEVVGAPDHFLEHGKPELLRQKYGLDAASIARRAIEGFHLVPVHGRLAIR